MEVLILFLVFISGGAAVVFYYRNRNSSIRKQLIHNIENLQSASVKKSALNKEEFVIRAENEFYEVWDKIKSLYDVQFSEPGKGDPDNSEQLIRLKKVIDNLQIINELGQRITSSLSLQQSFNHLYQTINSMMDAAVLELEVYDEHNNTFRLFSNLKNGEAPYTNHVAEWSRKNRREVYLTDAERDYARYVFEPLKMADGQPVKSIMVFPVNYSDKTTGTLSVISFKIKSFDPYHQEIIRSLLGYVSVAINNALTHEELERTKMRAEQSEKFKEQFLANMSHEIRTPINAVTGMTRLLLEKAPREDQLRYLESIRNASDSLLVIINDILDLSKIEAGKIELEQIPFSPAAVINNVRDIMQFKAEEKGISLKLTHIDLLPKGVIGDPTRLSQILINLLGNAIKFTSKGEVALDVEIEKIHTKGSQEESARIKFSVKDTGIGMTEEQQARLFMSYSQASSDTARKYGGTGLGLSITKQLVDMLGGNINANSIPGKGSTFTFTLDYTVTDNLLPDEIKSIDSENMIRELQGMRVLLVDDNEYNRIVARETLEMKLKDVMVDEASEGQEALNMIFKNKYDVVLMDLIMPGMDGLEATRQIRTNTNDHIKNMPVLALTASVIQSEINRAMEAGMNGFIPKPFKPFELLNAIYGILKNIKKDYSPNISVNQSPESDKNKTIDLDYLREFTEGDEDRLIRFINLFLSKIPATLSNIQESFEKREFEKIRIAVHSMKPQLRFMGINKGLDLAEFIEQLAHEDPDEQKLEPLINELNTICSTALLELEKAASA